MHNIKNTMYKTQLFLFTGTKNVLFVRVRVYFDFANTEPNNRPGRRNAASRLGLLNSVYAVQKKYREKLK